MTISISLDLETWGKRPGCDIRSIGACVFDPTHGVVGGETSQTSFYIACDNPEIDPEYRPEQRKYLLTRDPDTVQWWSEQSDEAQAAFTDPVDLREALVRFAQWLRHVGNPCKCIDCGGDEPTHSNDCTYMEHEFGEGRYLPPNTVSLWSHGAAFDSPILAAAYAACGLPVPWHYRAPRDTRTLFDIAGIDDHSAWLNQHPGPLGVAHHALDDSICQARAVCAAWETVHQWAVDSDDLAGAR